MNYVKLSPPVLGRALAAVAARSRLSLLLGSALALAGCPGPRDLVVSGLAPLEDAVLAVDETHGIARIVQLTGGTVRHVDLELGGGRVTILRRPQTADEVLLFSSGVPADEDEEGSFAELARVAHDGLRRFDGSVVPADPGDPAAGRWRFRDQYESVRLAGEDRYAMAYAPIGRLVVDNRVEIADLDSAPSDTNPVALSLRSLGGEVPAAVAISRPLAVGAGALRVVALLASGQLSLFDLDAPGVPPITIPTNQAPGTVGPEPVEAVFVGERIVVRTAGGDQLLVVSLLEADGTNGGQRFDVSISTLLTTEPVQRLVVDERASTPRLLALAGFNLYLFDLDAGLGTVVPLTARHTEALLFEGPAPGDPNVRDRAALFGSSGRVAFVDFGDQPLTVRGVFELQLDFTPSALVADLEAAQLVAFTAVPNGADPLDVSLSRLRTPRALVDLEDRSATPLSTTAIERSILSADLATLWVADEDGYVSRFDTRALTQQEAWLGSKVEFLLALPGAARLVLAFRDPRAGTFTVLDESVPDPARWRTVRGAF